MEQLHLLYLSDRDMQKITAIMKTVPDIHSPADAVSWALDNISVPRKNAPRKIVWQAMGQPGVEEDPIRTTPHPPFVELPTGRHKVAIYKIDAGHLANLDTNIIIGADALTKIKAAPTHCALLSKVSDLGRSK